MKYFEHILAYVSATLDFVSIFEFASLIGVPVGLGSSAVGIKIFEITAELKSISQLARKKKSTIIYLSSTEVKITKDSINSYINYDNIVSVNNVLKEYNEMKE